MEDPPEAKPDLLEIINTIRETLEKKIEELQQNLKAVQDKNDQLEQKNQELKEREIMLKIRIEDLEHENRSFQDQFAEIYKQGTESKLEVSKCNFRSKSNQENLEWTNEKLEESARNNKMVTDGLQSKISTLEKELAVLKSSSEIKATNGKFLGGIQEVKPEEEAPAVLQNDGIEKELILKASEPSAKIEGGSESEDDVSLESLPIKRKNDGTDSSEIDVHSVPISTAQLSTAPSLSIPRSIHPNLYLPQDFGTRLEPDNQFPRAPNVEIGFNKHGENIFFCLSKYMKGHLYKFVKRMDQYVCMKCSKFQPKSMDNPYSGTFQISDGFITPDPDSVPHRCIGNGYSLSDVFGEQCLRFYIQDTDLKFKLNVAKAFPDYTLNGFARDVHLEVVQLIRQRRRYYDIQEKINLPRLDSIQSVIRSLSD